MKTLTELRELNLPKGAAADITWIKVPEAAKAALDTYLSNFAKHSGCFGHGGTFSFNWGIQHGEGYCTECGYPARARHYVKYTDDAGEEQTLEFASVLAYHPDALEERV